MKTVEEWREEWRTFFEARAEKIDRLFSTRGCRERWLQGEAFLHFTTPEMRAKGFGSFHADASEIDTRSRTPVNVDFAAFESDAKDAPTQFVAELKVLGEAGYAKKVLSGGALGVLKNVHVIGPNDARLVRGWGLTRDYFRLLDCISPVRMLLVVVHKNVEPDSVGLTLRRLEFERPGDVLLDSDRVWAKAWFVGNQD